MYPYDHQILEKLLFHIDCGEFEQALHMWSEHRRSIGQSCDACPYDEFKQVKDCGMCLEGKLRTLSLYHHAEDNFGNILQDAARKLEAFCRQNHIISNSIT